jgi:hypothetical protein
MKALISPEDAPTPVGPYSPGLSCLVHLTDLSQFPAFNAIYEKKFTGIKPVRTTVRADLVAGMLVEISLPSLEPPSE